MKVGASPALYVQGVGQVAGTLKAGQDWTTTVPVGSTVSLRHAPVLTVNTPILTQECGQTMDMATLLAAVTASDQEDGVITLGAGNVTGTWPLPNKVLGPHLYTFNVVDSDGFPADPVSVTVNVEDHVVPVFSGLPRHTQWYKGTPFPAATALDGVTADDVCAGAIDPATITVEAFNGAQAVPFPVLLSDPQTYPLSVTLTYKVKDASGNEAVNSASTLDLVDNPPPVISLNGDALIVIECKTAYTDSGATATDEVVAGGGAVDVTGNIVPSGSVDTNTPGTYQIVYSVTDVITHLTTLATRTIIVQDTSEPVMTLNGPASVGVQTGGTFTDPGATATDACAGTLVVSVTGALDLGTPGTYTRTYSATDAGIPPNSASVTRTIHVGDLVNFVAPLPVGGDLYNDAPVTTPDLAITAIFEKGIAPASYQWYSKLGAAAAAPIAGASGTLPVANDTLTLTLAPNALPTGEYQVYVAIQDSDITDTYKTAPVLVRFGAHVAVTAPGLVDVSFVKGGKYDWGFATTGGIGTVTYQWFKDGAKDYNFGQIHDGGAITGTNTNTLHFKPFDETMVGAYQAEISDAHETKIAGPAVITRGAGVPVGSLFGLAALAAMTAMGGAASIRRRK